NVPSSCGLATGSILAEITSGDPASGEITFSLDGTDFQPVAAFDNLTAGAYTLQAKQGVCSAELDFSIGNAAGLNATVAVTPSACTTPSGSITVATTDAIGAVNFSLDGGSTQTDNTFRDLSPGEYEITATDASGCTVTLSATIISDVVFAQVESIVTNSCALSGCHAGNVSPDFRETQNIISRAERIRARTGNQSMPPPSSGVTLTSAEINAIACWVADGAPN
ncbi:MAG: hypothetical protein AAF597_05785, partial [Bacteroidota bacterium]